LAESFFSNFTLNVHGFFKHSDAFFGVKAAKIYSLVIFFMKHLICLHTTTAGNAHKEHWLQQSHLQLISIMGDLYWLQNSIWVSFSITNFS